MDREVFSKLRPLVSVGRSMPRKILNPRPLDFDLDASVRIRPSFEPKLLFSLFAFQFCWKSTHRSAVRVRISHDLNPPIGVSILSQPVEGILQAIDGINMAPVKTPDRVVFDYGNRPDSHLIRSDIKTEDSVSHVYDYQYCVAIARPESNNCAICMLNLQRTILEPDENHLNSGLVFLFDQAFRAKLPAQHRQ
jgi:hypothetical protein